MSESAGYAAWVVSCDALIVATKVGSDMGQGHKVLRKDYILQATEASLRRLQVECIDLYQSHWDDENTPFEETLGAYEQLIRQGKVKAIGASNYSAARLAQALEVSTTHATMTTARIRPWPKRVSPRAPSSAVAV